MAAVITFSSGKNVHIYIIKSCGENIFFLLFFQDVADADSTSYVEEWLCIKERNTQGVWVIYSRYEADFGEVYIV